ncbi:C40 family peptidase [Jeongeupia naejangsanensis]|uniref:C40 family peptidase n=1 Tax=Jeongeupia naejangsanensis TaxID=613195 RepID=A0ABS2BJ84_9NEIS|nr:C40 family peptidase [Jeongeupia naejangsanensis]MBM3115680.1 C40 family peptidase [Jeongeupia naejangsanensis]
MKWSRIPAALFVSACLSALLPTARADEPPADTGSWSKSSKDDAGDNQAAAQELLLQAMSLIGVRYSWGGNTPEEGLDCSGFIRYVFQNSLNITLPRTSLSMSQTGKSIDKEDLKPGDLVFFNTLGRAFSHVGIYLGDNRFIHSPRAGKSVEVSNIQQSYWQQRWNGARRIAGASGNGVNMTTLLASAGNPKTRKQGAVQVAAASEQNCRKVTTGKGKHKKTTTVCSRSATAKPASTKSTSKVGTKSSTKSSAAKSTKSTDKTSSKKSSATSSGKSSKTTKSTTTKKH